MIHLWDEEVIIDFKDLVQCGHISPKVSNKLSGVPDYVYGVNVDMSAHEHYIETTPAPREVAIQIVDHIRKHSAEMSTFRIAVLLENITDYIRALHGEISAAHEPRQGDVQCG